jgi:hypothetical protein
MSRTRGWDIVEADVQRLSDQADNLNRANKDSPLLGQQYEIGHTYFFDVARFLGAWQSSYGVASIVTARQALRRIRAKGEPPEFGCDHRL